MRTVPTIFAPPSASTVSDGVARVDRPAEARGALGRHDVAHLRGVEQRRDARHQVLAERGGRAEHVRERLRERRDLRREHRRQRVRVRRVLDLQHLRDVLQLRGLRRDAPASAAHTATVISAPGIAVRAGDALGGAGIEFRAVVLGDDQNLAHATSPFLRSASTSSCGVFTQDAFLPLRRRLVSHGLQALARLRRRGRRACSVSSGFFFAFMMSGSFT